jgi:hypothetical protein
LDCRAIEEEEEEEEEEEDFCESQEGFTPSDNKN